MNLLDAVKTKNIIKISLEDSLSSALSHLSSSHDAAFIFDDKKKFVGVINPYHALIHASYPGNAKVAHCLFHPQELSATSASQKLHSCSSSPNFIIFPFLMKGTSLSG